MTAVRPTLARPARDQRLDVVRGVLQLSIFAKHVAFSFVGGWVIHSNWGLSDSSELFVFLSGFSLGSVFALKLARDGWAGATRDLAARTWRLYRIHLAVFALFAALVMLVDATVLPGEARRLGWSTVFADPLGTLPGVLAMVQQPAFMGILPTFVWGMLLLPAFMALLGYVGGAGLLAALGLYAAVQVFGLHLPGVAVEFDPLAWQVLFLGGAWLGRRALLHGFALRLPPGWNWLVTFAAAALVAVGLCLRLGWYGFLPWAAPFAEADWVTGKEFLALPRLLHALALAWLVALLVPRDAPWMHRGAALWLATIGRHSLEVFCLGLFLAWGASHLLAQAGHALAVDLGLNALGFALLGGFAGWLQRRRGGGAVLVSPAAPARA